jgi:hypothetical protein
MVERRSGQRSLVRIRESAPLRADVPPSLDRPPAIEGAAKSFENGSLKSNVPLLIIAAGLLVAMFGYAAVSAKLTAKTAQRTFFGLNVAHTSSGLRLLWNPSAAALRGVTEAELIIVDGDYRSQLLLSPGQIRSGNLFYTPFTDEVRFTLRAQGSGHVANETVLALNQRGRQSTAQQGAVTFPAATWQDLMSNLTTARASH